LRYFPSLLASMNARIILKIALLRNSSKNRLNHKLFYTKKSSKFLISLKFRQFWNFFFSTKVFHNWIKIVLNWNLYKLSQVFLHIYKFHSMKDLWFFCFGFRSIDLFNWYKLCRVLNTKFLHFWTYSWIILLHYRLLVQ
jgi:hypothetical protein